MGPAPMPVDEGKLSPAFVEWMMGFPPGWTDQMSRTQALKALGNAVVWQQAYAAAGWLCHSSNPEEVMPQEPAPL